VTAELTGICQDHSFESAEDICRRCGAEYCELCLVYPFGPAKPLCKECAMTAGGVRAHVSQPALAKKELRRKVKAFEAKRRKLTDPATPADAIEVTDPMLHDPLEPTPADLERVPVSVTASVTTSGDGAEFADGAVPAQDETSPPPPATEPANGVAPLIDWSQPFG